MKKFSDLNQEDFNNMFSGVELGYIKHKSRAKEILKMFNIIPPDDLVFKIKFKQRKIIIGNESISASLSFKNEIKGGFVINRQF